MKASRQSKAWELFQEIEKRFLQNVERQFVIAGEAESQAVDPIAMTTVKRGERLGIPSIHRCDQLVIAPGVVLFQWILVSPAESCLREWAAVTGI